MTLLPTLADIEAAAELVYTVIPPTPQIRWPLLCARVGAETWVKHENHSPVGAFKLRGGLVYMDSLRRRHPGIAGVIAATRGNHGQSVAFAANRAGLRAVIVVPYGNSPEKNAAMRALGAELLEYGQDFQEAYEHSAQLADPEKLHLAPSFDSSLVAGVATYALELFRAVRDMDAVYAVSYTHLDVYKRQLKKERFIFPEKNRVRGALDRQGHRTSPSGRQSAIADPEAVAARQNWRTDCLGGYGISALKLC